MTPITPHCQQSHPAQQGVFLKWGRAMASQMTRAEDGRRPLHTNPLLDGFDERLTALVSRQETVEMSVEAVADVVQALIGSLEGDLQADDLHLYNEVEGLADFIRSARAEIVAINPTDIREEFLPTAADELDAIVQATEQATGAIMDVTEMIEDVIQRATPEDAETLQNAVTAIYEACSFQDITGQRITKVVRMLKSIEVRVDALVAAFAPKGGLRAAALITNESTSQEALNLQQAGNFGRTQSQAVGDRPDDSSLLNGPQANGDAMGQDDIDALLKSFD